MQDDDFFWDGVNDGKLLFQCCSECGTLRNPPGPMCPACGSLRHEWARASGRARLVSWVVVHPPVLPAWKDRVPYPVVLVECEEGVRTIGGLAGAGPRRPVRRHGTARVPAGAVRLKAVGNSALSAGARREPVPPPPNQVGERDG